MSAMKVLAGRTWTGEFWHIRGINGRSLCGRELRDFSKELEINHRRLCPLCKDKLFRLLTKKKKINELLRSALP